MIAKSSYYILDTYIDNGQKTYYARFCDVDGNSLYRILISPSEYDQATISGRLDRLLDPKYIGRAHPANIMIDQRYFSLGRVATRAVYFRDKHNDIITYQSYNGPTDLTGLVKHQLNDKSACRVDYAWMLANNIPVIDCYSERIWCSIM